MDVLKFRISPTTKWSAYWWKKTNKLGADEIHSLNNIYDRESQKRIKKPFLLPAEFTFGSQHVILRTYSVINYTRIRFITNRHWTRSKMVSEAVTFSAIRQSSYLIVKPSSFILKNMFFINQIKHFSLKNYFISDLKLIIVSKSSNRLYKINFHKYCRRNKHIWSFVFIETRK